MTARTKKIAINLTALVSAIIAVTAWGAPRVGAFVDARYVHADTFALLRLRDSLNYRQDIKDIHRILAGIDSALHAARPGRR